MKIGFIGLGNLGTPIAQNILESGHELYVYNRTASKTKPLTDKGAIACASIEQLAQHVTIVFTMVSDDAAITSVSTGQQGLINQLAPGSTHISMSTILPQTASELAEQHTKSNLHYLAAPVFGRPEAARARKLNFVTSGEENIRREMEPLLKDAGGAGVWDFGSNITAANTVKLCGNFTIASALEAIGESISLAQNSGVDPQKMWDVFTQTMFSSPVYSTYSKIISNKQFEPAAFTMQLGLKDMNLVLQQAQQVQQSMPLAQLLQKHMQQLVQEGKQDTDWSSVAQAAG
jgi:3-hydroxyisobutyrate dehydrogenase-like beta-hydroxyacid dehydrogenase